MSLKQRAHGSELHGAERTDAQSDTELEALNQRVTELYRAGKYAEAIPLAERYAAAMKARYGPERPEYATALNNLAGLLKDTNRLAEAEPLYRRALAIDENSFGPEHPDVARVLNNLALLLTPTGSPKRSRSIAAR
jgi:tetratricopeptide (TPR) repeat protein